MIAIVIIQRGPGISKKLSMNYVLAQLQDLLQEQGEILPFHPLENFGEAGVQV